MNRGTLIAAPLLLLAGCGGQRPDMGEVENTLSGEIAEQVGVNAERIAVDCPSEITWAVGEDFRCIAEDNRGNQVKVTVYMENDEGEFSWETS